MRHSYLLKPKMRESEIKKKNLALVFLIILQLSSFSQEIKISKNLVLTKVSDNIYIHTQKNNNGIVYFNNSEAIIVSTPDSDIETQNLINWVKNKAKITAYVIDRWHPDAMQGLDIVNKNDIKTYSTKRTQKIARQKGLPITEFIFKTKKTIKVGDEKIVCHYLGEAHTTDGIVVWIPSEKILFAGNEIRNHNGWIGNIADANISAWTKTAQKIKSFYGKANIVIPGHGKYGGIELINYTIKLYDFAKDRKNSYNLDKNSLFIKDSIGIFYIQSYHKNDLKTNVTYGKGVVKFEMRGKKVSLFFDSATYEYSSKQIKIPSGFIKIKNKLKVESFYFNQAYIKSWNTPVEITLVIKEIKNR